MTPLDRALDAPGGLETFAAAWPSLERAARVELARAHPVFWAMLTSEGRWLPARHLFYLARMLMRIVRGESRRLIVSMPPRHGKTAFVWRHFGSWWLGARPTHKVMGVTYQGRQACRWSKQARNDLAMFGPEVFGVGASLRAAAEEWPVLRAGRPTEGLMNALGAEGALTGKGGDLLLGDDLVRGVEATRNPDVRDALYEWFDSDCLSRFENPESAAVLIGTRWHEDDVIGRVLAAQAEGAPPGGYAWEVINLPLLAEENDPLGRAPGEALWPERWTQEWAEAKKRTTPPLTFEALYQGRPTPKGGHLFEKRWVKYFWEDRGELVADHVRVSASSLVRFLTVDPNWSKKTSADYTALGAWALDRVNNRLFLLDVIHKRCTAPEVREAMLELMEGSGATVAYVEAQNLKLDEMEQLRRSGIPMREIQPNTDKVARFMPVQGHASTGRLLFRANAPWLAALERELCVFDNGDHDDLVDMVSYAVHVANELCRASVPPKIPPREPRPPAFPGLARPR